MPAVQLRDEQREDHRQQQRESRRRTPPGLHGEGQRQSAQPDYDGIRYERPGPLEPGDAEELRERPGHQNGHQNCKNLFHRLCFLHLLILLRKHAYLKRTSFRMLTLYTGDFVLSIGVISYFSRLLGASGRKR